MRQLWRQHGQCAPVLPQLRVTALSRRLLLAGLFALVLTLAAMPVAAAEVLQVRSAALLQVGDQNRSYSVALACLELPADQGSAATDWLRRDLPRRTKVNLRPQGSDQGMLVARVERLDRGTDVAQDLIAAGYGQLRSDCQS